MENTYFILKKTVRNLSIYFATYIIIFAVIYNIIVLYKNI